MPGRGERARDARSGQTPAPAALWEWDLSTGRVCWSGAVTAVLCCPAELVREDACWWMSRVHPEDRPAREAAFQRALEERSDRWSCTYRLLCDAEGERPVLERGSLFRRDGVPELAAGELREVLPSAQAEADAASGDVRARQSLRELRTFIDSLPQLAWSADENGWLDYYNRRWFEYTGTTQEDMEGWGWLRVHDADGLPRMLKVWRHALATGQPWEDEFRLRRGSDGTLRWHLSRAMPVRDAEGRIVRWFGTNTDIHDQKLAAEEHALLLAREQRARREAEAASRAKDEFLALVSHELRTPLSAILGWAHLLRLGRVDAAKQADALEKIERNAKLQAKLIEDLLDVSRILSDKLSIERLPVELADPVRAAVEAARPSAGDGKIRLTFTDTSGGAVVAGSAERLQQIAGNLVTNAIKFTPEGGRVDVRVAAREGCAEIEVRDDGQGIAPDFLPHVFDRFRQADSSSTRSHGGLGLGLSLVRHLTELHGGEVTAQSEGDGKGATFVVRLPLLAETAAASHAKLPQPDDGAAAPVSLAGMKVLAVDDDTSARDVVAAMLFACGATVTPAGSVHEALRAFKLDPPDVVVSDIAMPEIDGYGLLAKIRELPGAAAHTPIVALTAYASAEDGERALRRGFDRYLAKPIDPGKLSRVVADAVRGRLNSS